MTYQPQIKDDYPLILALESSCDETSAAVIRDGRQIASLVISSQIQDHQKYGGVVPELASRKHVESISYVVQAAIKDAGVSFASLDAVAVTQGPGLVGALLVGVSYAKALAAAHQLPLVGVHHLDGHISSNYITHPSLEPPFLTLVVSGGHTLLVECSDYGRYKIIGTTRDDAAGEAFDKGARLMGLPYPGGRLIDDLAKGGNPDAIRFPRAKLQGNPMDFSYSGVKTALKQYIDKITSEQMQQDIHDIAASYQEAVVDVMLDKVRLALEHTGEHKLALAGGVAANSRLRDRMVALCESTQTQLYLPELRLCGDNAAMIGTAGYYQLIQGGSAGLDMNAVPYISLETIGQ